MRQLSEEEIQVDLREDHPEDVIIFMVAILGLGILVLFLVNLRGAQIYHLKVFLPYTVLIFVGAFVLGTSREGGQTRERVLRRALARFLPRKRRSGVSRRIRDGTNVMRRSRHLVALPHGRSLSPGPPY
eukprot:scaffold799_cov220-Pinguiococcus_pyrenoidosus.AAC.6